MDYVEIIFLQFNFKFRPDKVLSQEVLFVNPINFILIFFFVLVGHVIFELVKLIKSYRCNFYMI